MVYNYIYNIIIYVEPKVTTGLKLCLSQFNMLANVFHTLFCNFFKIIILHNAWYTVYIVYSNNIMLTYHAS